MGAGDLRSECSVYPTSFLSVLIFLRKEIFSWCEYLEGQVCDVLG